MLSLPVVAGSINRSSDMNNVIAASLIFILAFDPFLIRDTGFQLSYLAVTGIVILYKPVYDLYVTSSWLPDKIWALIAVSLAAQIGTFPVSLYFFHQFPNYFLVTNLAVVPLSSLIIYTGIIALVFGRVRLLGLATAKILVLLIRLLNGIIHFIEELPGSVTRGIYLTTTGMVLLYLLIIFLFLWFERRRASLLWMVLLTGILLNVSFLCKQIHRLGASGLTILQARGQSLLMFTRQDRATIFYNDLRPVHGISSEPSPVLIGPELNSSGVSYSRNYWLKGHRSRFINNSRYGVMIRTKRFLFFENRKVAILERTPPKLLNVLFKVDILVLTGNHRIDLRKVVELFHPDVVVADATNSQYRIRAWEKESIRLNVHFHAVTTDGAFQKDFSD